MRDLNNLPFNKDIIESTIIIILVNFYEEVVCIKGIFYCSSNAHEASLRTGVTE